MFAIVATVLKGTIGLLIKRGLKSASEKLKDGDVTDQQLRSWIMDEIDDVKSKLDAMARKDLGASISFFREGLVFLDKAMDTKTRDEGASKNVKGANQVKSSTKVDSPEAAKKKRFWSKWFSSNASPVKSLVDQGKKETKSGGAKNELSLITRELDAEAIVDAKKRFEDARRKATEAFNNEVLSPLDRILAMGVRLMATILEKVETPVSTLDACISGLNELHSMPFVTENFSVELQKGIKSRLSKDERRQIISFVCQVNRTIYDFASLVSTKEVLSFWPCVEIANEKVDPLRDSRMANMLRKLDMGDFSLAWSFGQKDELEHQRLASATSIATNTLGQFLVVDQRGSCVNLFDASGKFLKFFNPSTKSGRPVAKYGGLVAVATDQDDNIYVLENKRSATSAEAFLQVLNNSAQFLDEFKVGFSLKAVTVKVMASRLVLVPVHFELGYKESAPRWSLDDYYVVLNNTKGKGIGFLSEDTLKGIRDIATADDLIMILDRESTVFVFTDASVSDEDRPVSQFLKTFPVRGEAIAITFHPRSKHLIVVSKIEDHRWQLLFYSKEFKSVERSIDLDMEQGYYVNGAAVTTDGRICIAATNFMECKGKVLVV